MHSCGERCFALATFFTTKSFILQDIPLSHSILLEPRSIGVLRGFQLLFRYITPPVLFVGYLQQFRTIFRNEFVEDVVARETMPDLACHH